MATIEQLTIALKNADRAGDTEAARKIAAAIKAMRPAEPFMGKILPVSRQEPGGPVSFDSDAGFVGPIKRFATLGKDTMEGRVDLSTDNGLPGRVLEAASVAVPMNPAVRSGLKAIPGATPAVPTKKPVAIPTADDLLAAGGKQIETAEKTGVDFNAEAVANWARSQRATLERDFHPSQAKGTYALLKDIETAPPGSIMEFRGLTALRRNLQRVAQNRNPESPADVPAASELIRRIDEFLSGPPSQSVVAGPASKASRTYELGRGNYSAGKRSQGINVRDKNAELEAAVAASGRGSGNRIRAAAKWFIDPRYPERLHGFSPAEAKLIEGVARGNKGRNSMRYVGNLLGGGGGLGALVTGIPSAATIGMGSGSIIKGVAAGLVPVAVGATARGIDNRLTSKAMRRADEAVRSRSPLYNERLQNAPATAIPPQARAAIKAAGTKAAVIPQLPNPNFTTEEEYLEFLRRGGA